MLYSFRRCPYAIRARLALQVSGVAVALREVALRHKPAALIAASPKATVPVLQLPDGRVLDQSLDIMRWALQRHDPQSWLRAFEDPGTQAWLALNDGPFKQALDGYKYTRPEDAGQTLACRDNALSLLLTPLDRQLANSRFVLGDSPSLVDMALLPFVRQFAAVNPAWFKHSARLPQVQAWLQGLVDSPPFEAAMARYPPWRPGDPEVVFP